MPYLLVRCAAALGLVMGLLAAPAFGAQASDSDALVLGNGTTNLQVTGDLSTWIEPGRQATLETALSHPSRFVNTPALARHALSDRDTLWVKLRLARAVGNTESWQLNIPLPFVDSITLYQQAADGSWQSQIAGDSIAQSEWAMRGMYPEFTLNLPAGAPQDVYLQVRNFKHLSMPIRLATAAERALQRQLELLYIGTILGGLLTLSILSGIRYLEHKKEIDIWAGLYALLIAGSAAQINGLLNAVLWGPVPQFGDYANGIIPTVAVGCALLFVRDLYALSTHYRRYDAFLVVFGWSAIGSVLSYAVLDRATADALAVLIILVATSAGMLATVLAWRNGSAIGRWLMLAYVPQFLGVLRMVAEASGWLTTLWEVRYFTTISITMSVPLLSYALSRATHDRKELQVRANHLPTQDALTGLMTAEAFQLRLVDAVDRGIATREPIALVLVNVVNHDKIRDSMGDTTAEQCLLRAVIKLHRILRDVDPAGRVGTARFAVLMEGVSTRQAVTERMVKLIASGLIPLQGLEPEVTLQFQAACVMLHENPRPAEVVLDELETVLSSISPRSRRPIRFLEPVPTQAAPLTQEPVSP